MHKLIGELLAVVPPDGAPWPRPARQRWVTAIDAVLDLLYEDGPLSAPVSTAETTTGTNPSPFVDGPRPGASPGELFPPRAQADTSSMLDLRSDRPTATSGQGRHARPGTSDS